MPYSLLLVLIVFVVHCSFLNPAVKLFRGQLYRDVDITRCADQLFGKSTRSYKHTVVFVAVFFVDFII